MNNKNILSLIYVLLFILGPVSLLAQKSTGRIYGYLKDAQTGEPLMYANVVLEGTTLGAASDVHGYYVVIGVPSGNYTLKVMMMGYEQKTRKIFLRGDNELREDFELKVEPIESEAVTVTAERTRFKEKVEVSRVNLSAREIKEAPAFVEADVFRSLQLMPSVTSVNDFSSALVVRGGSPDENLILLDGIEIYNPYHMGGVFSTFNADAISDAEFLAGGFPCRYGNRNSSVLEITSKEGNSKQGRLFDKNGFGEYWDLSKLQGEVNLLSSKFLAEGPLYNGSWILSGRRTYFDKLAEVYYWATDQDMNWKYYFRDTQGKIIYNLDPENRLTFSSYNGRDVVNFKLGGSDEKVDFDWDWGNYTTSLQWRYVPNSKFLSTFSIAYTNYDFNVDLLYTASDSTAGEVTNNIFVFNELKDWTVKEKIDWFATSQHTVTGGFEFKNLGMKFDLSIGEMNLFSQKQTPYIASAYLQDKWQPTPLLSIQPGARLSKYELHDQLYVEPRVGFKYLLSENLALKGAWGKYKQFMFTTNDEDAILNIVDFWQPIPENYSAKSVQHFILGVEQWIGEGYFASLEGYYKPYDVTLTINPKNNPAIDTDDYIEGTGRVYGVELLLKKTTGKLNGWIGYTYQSSQEEYDFNSDGRIIEEHGEIYSQKYDRPHTLNCVVNYSPNKKHTFGLIISASSGQLYTPTVGYVYSQSNHGSYINPYENIIELQGAKNSVRYPTYFRTDVSWIKHISPFGIDGKFKVQIVNVTNHFNILFYNWNLSENSVTAVSMFPIVPTVGFEFKF